MDIIKNCKDIKELLEKHNQGHLLTFYDRLDTNQKGRLLEQIRRLDFDKMDKWVVNYVQKSAQARKNAKIAPVLAYESQTADPQKKSKYAQAVDLGKELIRQSKVAAFVVAGGQGTRLGFDGPKGNFSISPVKNKTFFQLFAETITAASARYRAAFPWYIMTSPLNHAQTIEIFRSNKYYGLSEENVFIFQQGTMPNFSADGKVLLADKSTIACSPDGHGGSLKALHQSGALEDMKQRGIEFLSYWQVDNPLTNIFDPLFLGLHILDKAEMSSKALVRTSPQEKVGLFCLVDGKVTVIEYSELQDNDELFNSRNPDGSLVFKLASIGIHLINRIFVEKLNAGDFSLPLHKAVKDIPQIDENGNSTQSEGIKLESFVFDALPLASNSIILQTVRSEEFAPTKNATGLDSVESTKKMIVDRAADWLESAGITIPKRPDGSVDCLLEIAPSFALVKDDIKEKLNQIPKIAPGDRIYLD